MKQLDRGEFMRRKKYNKLIDIHKDSFIESDENYYFIVGHTSNGAAYGVTWEEAIEAGLVERDELNQEDDELPF